MTINEYQTQAIRTARKYTEPTLAMAVFGLGLVGEAGETADLIKKIIGHGHELDTANLDKLHSELGDVLWYVALLADTLGFTLEDIAQNNIDKLTDRYPDGFSTERSINRN